MDNLPPAGTVRRRVVVGTWVIFTGVFIALLMYGLNAWARGQAQPPFLAAIGGVGSFIGIWRWIAASAQADTQAESGH